MSIGGGGGGGFLGAIGSIVGGVFGGPIGAMIGQMVGQLVQSVAGQVLQEVGQQLGNVSQQGQQAGQDALNQALGGGGGSSLDPASLLNNFISQLGGGTPQQTADAQNSLQDLQKAIGDMVNQMMQDSVSHRGHRGGGDGAAAAGGSGDASAAGGSGDAGSVGSAGGSDDSSGDDFFIAMAKALGSTLQKQADKVKALSDKLTNDSDKEQSKDQTLLMGESQKMSFLAQAVQTAISSVGQALGTVARKE